MTAKKSTKTGKKFRGGGGISDWPEYMYVYPFLFIVLPLLLQNIIGFEIIQVCES